MAGTWNVKEIEDGLSAKQFLGWETYFNLEPRGEERADYRSAQIVGMIFNMAVDIKNRKPFTDWLLKFEAENKKQPTPSQVAQKQFELLNILARVHNAEQGVVEDKRADRAEQSKLQKAVAQAHAAMKR